MLTRKNLLMIRVIQQWNRQKILDGDGLSYKAWMASFKKALVVDFLKMQGVGSSELRISLNSTVL